LPTRQDNALEGALFGTEGEELEAGESGVNVQWDPIDLPIASSILFRPAFLWGPRGSAHTPYVVMLHFEQSPSYPILNSATGTMATRLAGAGFGYHKELLPWLSVEPNLVVGSQSVTLELTADDLVGVEAVQRSPTLTASNAAIVPSISLRGGIPVGPVNLSIFLDLDYATPTTLTLQGEQVAHDSSLELNEIQALRPVDVVTVGGLGGRVGLSVTY
jgi:hypothetical protein